jgi:DNA-binding XRE family transcriptional regulator
MKLSNLTSADAVLAAQLEGSPALRDEWDRLALARTVAHRVLAYRVEHGLTQTQLARLLGVQQPAIARLEAGEHEPSIATLARLARQLHMRFHIEITPDACHLAG